MSQEETNDGYYPQIILLGFYREASSLLQEMLSRYSKSTTDKLLVVDFNPEAHHKLKEMGIQCKYGDIGHADTLKHLDLSSAKLLICTIPDHLLKGTNNLKLLKTLKKLATVAKIIVTAETIASAREMYKEGADYVFIPRLVTAHYLADVVERIQVESSASMKEGAISHLEKRIEVLP